MTRHFLALHDYTKDELDAMLALAADLKGKQKHGVPHRLLDGKTVAMIFEKASTRTRVSFEVGVFQLGGHGLFMPPANSQMGRGEPIKDSARVMSRYCDGVMIRTFGQEIVDEFASYSRCAGHQRTDRPVPSLPDHGRSADGGRTQAYL